MEMSKGSNPFHFRIGIDVSGTFTDITLLNLSDNEILSDKILTSYPDPSVNVMNGILKLVEQGLNLSAVKDIVHGTTLIINTLIERKGTKTALITTQG